MERQTIRLLRADEIECRAATVSEKGVSLLLYKDARVDQRILDETFGIFGWQRTHQCIDGNLYCTVEVYDKESGRWVSKQDVGTPGCAEKEKSSASDSFKRACFNWGIGRELYTAPFIWIPADKAEISRKDNKFHCSERFAVSSIGFNDDREITELVVVNGRGKPVYEMKTGGTKTKETKEEKKTLTKKQMDFLKGELKRTGVAMEAVQERYHIGKPETMGAELYCKVMEALSKTKTAA